MKKIDIPVNQKYVLTLEEASAYFSIGRDRLRQLIRENESADWILWIGSHAHIKREPFEVFVYGLNAL